MAGVITWNRLRELAAFRAQNGLAISLYIGFDPSAAGAIPNTAATKMNSLLDEAQKSTLADRGELTHDQKAGLQSDFERIRNFFANDLTAPARRDSPFSPPGSMRSGASTRSA